MYNLLLTLLLVMSAIIVIAVFMQPQKNPSSNVFDGGGSEALFERSKPRGLLRSNSALCNALQESWFFYGLRCNRPFHSLK